MESSTYIVPHCALPVHLSVSLITVCHCSLLTPTLQIKALRLREVKVLALSHTAEKLTPVEVYLPLELPR